MKKFMIGVTLLVFVVHMGCSQKENPSTKESTSNREASVESPE